MSSVTVGDSYRILRANGYAPTSAKCPSRKAEQNFGVVSPTPVHWDSLAADPAAILCWPTPDNGGSGIPDLDKRRVAKLTVHLGNKRELAAVDAALEKFAIGGGPRCIDSRGRLIVPLALDGEDILFSERSFETSPIASLACADRELSTFQSWRSDPGASVSTQRCTFLASCLIELSGSWSNGSLLDTPRDKLPRLYRQDAFPIVRAIGAAVSALREEAA